MKCQCIELKNLTLGRFFYFMRGCDVDKTIFRTVLLIWLYSKSVGQNPIVLVYIQQKNVVLEDVFNFLREGFFPAILTLMNTPPLQHVQNRKKKKIFGTEKKSVFSIFRVAKLKFLVFSRRFQTISRRMQKTASFQYIYKCLRICRRH